MSGKVFRLGRSHFPAAELEQAGFGALISSVLSVRFPTAVQAYEFVTSFQYTPPTFIPGIREAVQLVLEALANNIPILIAGDYDADGICGTAILVRYLKKYNAKVFWYLPTRAEGYGLNTSAVKTALKHKCGVLIAVDCGTNDYEAVEFARKEGLKVVIVDHHIPGDKTAEADIIINPHVNSGLMSFKHYCGAGLAYKLVEALAKAHGNMLSSELLIMAGIATCADVMPLIHENRFLVKQALECWTQNESPWVIAFREVLDIHYPTAQRFSWTIGPILNAPGRISAPLPAIELLLTDRKEEAIKLTEELVKINRERQEKTESAEKMFSENIPEELGKAIVLSGYVPKGLAGLVAGRLADKYGRPTIILSEEGDIWHGSGRAPEGIDILNALVQAKDCLEKFGGHKSAVGLTVRPQNVEALKNILESVLPETYVPVLDVDALVNLDKLQSDLVSELSLLEPFGEGNPEPLFLLRGLYPKTYRTKTGEHLRLKVDQKYLIWFQAPPHAEEIPTPWDLAVSLSVSSWAGRPEIQAVVKHVAPSIYLDRDTIAKVYTYLYTQDYKTIELIPKQIIKVAIAIFQELNLIDNWCNIIDVNTKKDLWSSNVYRIYAG